MSNLLLAKKDHTQLITINRPEKLNALNRDTISELSEALKNAEADPEVRVVIICGAGEKAFVAGADISEFASFSIEEGKAWSKEGHDKLFNLVEQLSKPVIAAVNGFALGGGLELAMASHIRIASKNAKLGLPEVSLGVIPGYGGTQRLAQLVGKGKANEMIFSAGMIAADEAEKGGLVNRVVDIENLLDTCFELAAKISKNSPKAISFAIQATNAGFVDGVDGFNKEIECFGESFGTEDFKQGTKAFLEKRRPTFSGN